MSNPLILKTNELIRAKTLLHERHYVDLKVIKRILNTPFSAKVPFSHYVVNDEATIKEDISKGVLQLATLQGFIEVTEDALYALSVHIEQMITRFAKQYRVSEVRRSQNIPTAFKSSIQHVLCSNLINDPDSLYYTNIPEISKHSQVVDSIYRKNAQIKGKVINRKPDFTF